MRQKAAMDSAQQRRVDVAKAVLERARIVQRKIAVDLPCRQTLQALRKRCGALRSSRKSLRGVLVKLRHALGRRHGRSTGDPVIRAKNSRSGQRTSTRQRELALRLNHGR
jgi:hypothetical protein